jgi:hypothetical protein
MVCLDTAPAFQPAAPIFVSVFPEIETPVTFVKLTSELFEITTLVKVFLILCGGSTRVK